MEKNGNNLDVAKSVAFWSKVGSAKRRFKKAFEQFTFDISRTYERRDFDELEKLWRKQQAAGRYFRKLIRESQDFGAALSAANRSLEVGFKQSLEKICKTQEEMEKSQREVLAQETESLQVASSAKVSLGDIHKLGPGALNRISKRKQWILQNIHFAAELLAKAKCESNFCYLASVEFKQSPGKIIGNMSTSPGAASRFLPNNYASVLYSDFSTLYSELAANTSAWLDSLRSAYRHMCKLEKNLCSQIELYKLINSVDSLLQKTKRVSNARLNKVAKFNTPLYIQLTKDMQGYCDYYESISNLLSRSSKQDPGVIVPRESICISTANKLLDGALGRFEAVRIILQPLVEQVMVSIRNGAPTEELKSEAKELMVALLKVLDALLLLEICLGKEKQFRNFMKQTITGRSDLEETEKKTLLAFQNSRLSEINAGLEKLQSVTSVFQDLRKTFYITLDEISAAPSGSPGFELMLRLHADFVEKSLHLDEPEQHFWASLFTQLKDPVVKATALLEKFERVYANGAPVEPGMEFDELDRADMMRVVAEMISAEEFIHSFLNENILTEKENLMIWQAREQMSARREDGYLQVLARRRRELHESTISVLEGIMSNRNQQSNFEPPEFVHKAISVVERIEKSCSLTPKPLVSTNAILLSVSLLDRMLFLMEYVNSKLAADLDER